jgi:hypothetical protein
VSACPTCKCSSRRKVERWEGMQVERREVKEVKPHEVDFVMGIGNKISL